MSYTIEFYNEAVKGEILEWPAGMHSRQYHPHR